MIATYFHFRHMAVVTASVVLQIIGAGIYP